METQSQQEEVQQQEQAMPPAPEDMSSASVGVLEAALAETERKRVDEARAAILVQFESFKQKQRLAHLFAKSGCFADIKGTQSPEQAIAQAFVKIELGESMGFSPAESMQGVQLIQGTPAVNAQLRAARMQRAGYHWDIDWFEDAQGICHGCRLWLYRNGKPLLKPLRGDDGSIVHGEDGKPLLEHVSVSFTRKDAEMLKTQIWEGPQGARTKREASVLEKDNWKNTPRNMYFARCVTNAQRFHAPGVLSGDVPSVEEVMDWSSEEISAVSATLANADALKRRLREAKDQGKAPAAAPAPERTEQQEPPASQSAADAAFFAGMSAGNADRSRGRK